MIVNIDNNSGFCFGVKKTIQLAEEILKKDGHLYCLGKIVHNEEEISRLEKLGLETIDHETFFNLHDTTVLLRSHGEPPETYQKAIKNNIKIIEGTCPVVIKLQEKVKRIDLALMDKETQVIIFGNESHPEVISLKGQSKGSVLVSKNFEEIKSKVNPDLPLRVFSQTTQNTEAYKDFITEIKGFLNDNNSEHNLEYTNSICKAVSNRNISLSKFATENDIIIFVGGKNSSNGKMLFEHCRNINVNSYYISNSSELDKNWFVNKNSAGVCGATSTPQWLMEEIAKEIITI